MYACNTCPQSVPARVGGLHFALTLQIHFVSREPDLTKITSILSCFNSRQAAINTYIHTDGNISPSSKPYHDIHAVLLQLVDPVLSA